MRDDEITVYDSEIIRIPYEDENFTIEYNVNNETWIAFHEDEEEFDYNIIIEGEIIDKDNVTEDYEMIEDLDVFGYLLTTAEFEELKLNVISNL